MRKKGKQKKRDFDARFDAGEVSIDFSSGVPTEGFSKTKKLSPLTLPAWLEAEIERRALFQANSKASVVRQLLVEAVGGKKR